MKLPKAEIKKRVDATADLLGLTEWIDRTPGQLSGGQRQRVAMGRAIVREPSVFLMDEPLSNLDAKLRVQMRTEVLRIQRQLGVATLYVTHDQIEAMTMGDRVAVIRAGVLQQLASPQALYDRPANLFVASFMGSPSMNLYEASVAGPVDRLVVSLGSQSLALPPELGRRLPALVGGDGRGLIVGIRPEHLTVPPSGSSVEEGRCLVADIELVEALGNELLVHFLTDAKTAHEETAVVAADEPVFAGGEGVGGAAAANGVARLDPQARVVTGERVTFSVKVEALHFFDPETGLALEDVSA
jgi:multiple sugar transport system ATP-binding protein